MNEKITDREHTDNNQIGVSGDINIGLESLIKNGVMPSNDTSFVEIIDPTDPEFHEDSGNNYESYLDRSMSMAQRTHIAYSYPNPPIGYNQRTSEPPHMAYHINPIQEILPIQNHIKIMNLSNDDTLQTPRNSFLNSSFSEEESLTDSDRTTSSSPVYTYSNTTHSSVSSAPNINYTYDENRVKKEDSSEHKSTNSSVKTKRSRMGCLTCRQRKKRCCERKPNCYECGRLGLNCKWPAPGTEYKNKPRNVKNHNEGMLYHSFFGNIKILRGVVEPSN